MKNLFFSLSCLMFFIAGCKENQIVLPKQEEVKVSFTLADTSGQQSTIFHTNDNFIMSLCISNQTKRDIIYHYTPPIVGFRILIMDSTIVSSWDGYMFPQVFITDTLLPGKSYNHEWIAPMRPPWLPAVHLAPGHYIAQTIHAPYGDPQSSPIVREIEFTIIP